MIDLVVNIAETNELELTNPLIFGFLSLGLRNTRVSFVESWWQHSLRKNSLISLFNNSFTHYTPRFLVEIKRTIHETYWGMGFYTMPYERVSL